MCAKSDIALLSNLDAYFGSQPALHHMTGHLQSHVVPTCPSDVRSHWARSVVCAWGVYLQRSCGGLRSEAMAKG
eukprot:2697944-Amphidinium_carterae.2